MSYLGLALLFAAFAVVVAVVAAVRRPDPRRAAAMAVTAMALVVLTIVFDSVMVLADLFRYADAQLVGIRVWRAPIEDLAWPIAAALLLPSVWALLAPAPAPTTDREVDRVG